MNAFVNGLIKEANYAYTNNGALTNNSSNSKVLDFFFIAGASRNMSEQSISELFRNSLSESVLNTLKILFYARDVREGLGERRIFRLLFSRLTPQVAHRFEHLVPFYGRWDDLFLNEKGEYYDRHLDFIVKALISENTPNKALLCKWLPRQGHFAGKIRSKLAKIMNVYVTPKMYRKLVVKNSMTVEQLMSKNNWKKIDYSKIPGQSLFKYIKAFKRHDEERFNEFLTSKATKKNTTNNFPHQVYTLFKRKEVSSEQLQSLWDSLPDYVSNDLSFFPMIDVSGSMTTSIGGQLSALDVAVSLGLYLSEKNKSIFKNHYLTFSNTPQIRSLVDLKSIEEKFSSILGSNWGYSTNIEAAFDRLLEIAIKNNVSQEEMPKALIILSDMEFNEASNRNTNFKVAKKKYKDVGYDLPTIVFWNLNGRQGNNPATINDNAVLLSGFTPKVLKYLLSGNLESLTPLGMLNEVLISDRYSLIK